MTNSRDTSNKDTPLAITCSCGNAKSFTNSRVFAIRMAVAEELQEAPPVMQEVEIYKIRDILRGYHQEITPIVKRCGAWDFLTRDGASSDKVLIIPSINSFVNLKDDIETLKEIKGKEMLEIYEKYKQ